LRDRLDLTVDVPPLPPSVLHSSGEPTSSPAESSDAVRRRVVAARARQLERYRQDGVRTNAELTPALMVKHCGTDAAGRALLEAGIRHLTLSARAYDRVQKVARTIADLAGCERIAADHLAEALQFRM
jgi:magnesium chelatase family protein